MFCRLARWRMWSSMDDGRPPGRFARGHLGSCARCRRYRERARALDAALRAGAAGSPSPESSGARAPRRRWAIFARGAVAVAALAVVLGAVGTATLSMEPAPVAERSPAAPLKDKAYAVLESTSLPTALADLAGGRDRLSIRRELENLEYDAKSGLEHVLRVGGLAAP